MNRVFILIIIIFLSGHCIFSQNRVNTKWAKVPYSNSKHWLFNANDSITGSWNYIAPMDTALYGVASCYLQDLNKIFLCGGKDINDIAHVSCYLYDIATNTYTQKASLPAGRFSGKLVRVKDSLYLVGSGNGSIGFQPDGALYRYDIHANSWQIKASMQAPVLQEMAVCVWSDTIVTIGGSSDGFIGSTNSVRVYYPIFDTWVILNNEENLFLDNIMAADAECIGNNIVVVGGLGMLLNETVYRGYIPTDTITSLYWLPDDSAHPFSYHNIYRVGGGQWGSYMLFGPALYNDSVPIPEIWGFNIVDSTWTRFLPNPIDSIADVPTIAVKPSGDSIYFYLFGGAISDTLLITSHAERYSAFNPIIGITEHNSRIPSGFKLLQNYPNPFNPTTVISYEMPVSGYVRLTIYDILGREIKILVNGYQKAGYYDVRFNAGNLASGVYFYRILAYDFAVTKKMVLLK